MSNTNNNPSVGITKDDLKEIIASAVAAAVQESKKPAPLTDVELAAIEQENQLRAETAQLQIDAINNRKFRQETCTHRHSTGESHAVLIQESSDRHYVLCQSCQAKIRPGVAPKNYGGNDFYDTALFNRLIQEIQRSDM